MDQEYDEYSLWGDYEYKHTPIINRIYVMADVEDLDEQNLLDPQHGMWVLTFGKRLHTTPLSPNISSILDVGTGTGLWANAIAHAFPIAEVIATDLVPTPRQDDTAPNVHYIQHNADDPEWAHFKDEQCDYIHVRMVTGGIHDWPVFRKKCFRHLKPRGALKIIDLSYPLQADEDGQDSEDASALVKFVQLTGKSLAQDGLDHQVSSQYIAGFKEAGIEDVEEEIYRWPIGAWPEDDQEKKLGLLAQRNMDKLVRVTGRHVLTNKGFLSLEDTTSVIDEAKEELLKTDERGYFSVMKAHIAQEPEKP